MFGGKEERVRLLMDNQMAGVVIDRFGKDVSMVPVDDNHFSISVDVVVSQQFFGWVFALGKGVKIIGPESVVQQVNQEIKRLVEQYNME